MTSSRSRATVFSVLLIGLALLAPPLGAESAARRTASGKPDLSGTYDAATLTPFTRPAHFGDKLYLTPEEAAEIAEQEAQRRAERAAESDPDRDAPPEGGDGSEGAAGNVGGYNTFWTDPGDGAFQIDGKYRTSILIDPPDGQMPPMTAEGQKAMAARFSSFRRGNDGRAWWLEQGDGSGPFDNMEQRNVAERCVLGFTGVAPTLPSLYNNFKRIVQTEDSVVIVLEMVHDARIVRMNSEHAPPEERFWLGDSIGWWEGDTLVIETTNFRPETSFRGSDEMKVTERLSLLDDGNVLYNFTVDDPKMYTATYTGEYVWRRSDQKLFEYACHEGNYALGNILRGARILEADVLSAKESTGGQ